MKKLLGVLSLVVGMASCRQSEPPICSEYIELDETSEEDQLLPADVWYAILIPGTTRRPELRVPEQPRECSGRKVDSHSDGGNSMLPRKQLGAADLTLAVGPEQEIYVWARTDYFTDGTAIGPVAVAHFVARGIEIRGIGTLRAPHQSVRLRMEKFGENESMLVASGKICSDTNTDCPREVYLVPLMSQLFRTTQLVVEGKPAGPAKYRTREIRESPPKDGWFVREELYRSLDFVDGVPVISEVLQVRDCEEHAGPDSCEERKEHPHRRKLEWREGAFYTVPSLWEERSP